MLQAVWHTEGASLLLCQASLNPFWTGVILSAAKNRSSHREILRSTQNDTPHGAMKLDKVLHVATPLLYARPVSAYIVNTRFAHQFDWALVHLAPRH